MPLMQKLPSFTSGIAYRRAMNVENPSTRSRVESPTP